MSSYRSSSQVSVYNYPEHLNPFYEDEQHKRLRFWKVKKNNNSSSSKNGKNVDSGSSIRRGSFNFGSLRDLFPLRSFRNKKQSSTLGISMTSESPPPLRRDLADYNKEDEDRYAAYDSHFRHTIDQRVFQRNAQYRSSLQNMNTPTDLTFARNNRYRSTIQNGSIQHISAMRHNDGHSTYSGYTPKGGYLTGTPRMTPGSSMNSISTNPFDDDDDDVAENVEEIITANNVVHLENSLSSLKKPARKKKRQAPSPPNKTVTQGFSKSENTEIRANENIESSNGLDELSRLTAEFESFVKNSQNDVQEPKLIINEDEIITTDCNQGIKSERIDVKKSSKQEQQPKISVEIERNTSIKVERTQLPATSNEDNKIISEHRVVVRREIESPDKTIAIIQEDLKIKEIELKIKEDELRIKEALEEANKESNIEKVSDGTNKKVIELSPDIQTVEVHQITTEIRKFPEVQRITPTPTPSREITPDFIPLPVREKFDVLRIDENENENDIKKPEDIKEEKSLSNIQIQNTDEKPSAPLDIKESKREFFAEPLQTKLLTQSDPIQEIRVQRDRTPIPLARTEIENRLSSQGYVKVEKPRQPDVFEKCIVRHEIIHDDNDEDDIILRDEDVPKVPERRRSVKEIIESINRQQQKLKINQPASPQLPRKNYYFGEQKPALPPKDNVLLKLQRQAENERRINILLDDLKDFGRENPDVRRTQKFPVTECDTNNNSTFPNDRLVNPIPKPRRVM